MFQKHESLNKLLGHIRQLPAGDPPQGDGEHILHRSWLDRGCTDGTSEADWLKAEDEFRKSPQTAS